MEKKPEEIYAEQWLKETRAEMEIKSFRPDEMIACPQCARTSPPTRLKCFYCGAELPLDEKRSPENIKPSLRRLEDWEKGFNAVILPSENNFDEAKLKDLAELARLEAADLREISTVRESVLPLARVETANEAEIVRRRAAGAGLECAVVADEDLQPEIAPRRLRRVDFQAEALVLTLFNADEIVRIRPEDLKLVVTGAVFERRIEATEQRRKKATKTLETTETGADEMLIDVYAGDDPIGYRIVSTGFDFSGLEREMGMLARENMRRLAEKLRAFAPPAKFVENYLQIREILGKVWEVAEKKDSRGLQRKAFGRFNLENVTTINNLAQFTKFSRLQHRQQRRLL